MGDVQEDPAGVAGSHQVPTDLGQTAIGFRSARPSGGAVAFPQGANESNARVGQAFHSGLNVGVDGVTAFHAKQQSNPSGSASSHDVLRPARKDERVGVTFSQMARVLQLAPEPAASRIEAKTGEQQAAERVDAAAANARQIEIQAQRIPERRLPVLFRDVVRKMRQLGQQIVVQIENERVTMEGRDLGADFDGKPNHRCSLASLA